MIKKKSPFAIYNTLRVVNTCQRSTKHLVFFYKGCYKYQCTIINEILDVHDHPSKHDRKYDFIVITL